MVPGKSFKPADCGRGPGRLAVIISYFKTSFYVILNAVKDLNLLKMRGSSLRLE
jgi:hypothetical protein